MTKQLKGISPDSGHTQKARNPVPDIRELIRAACFTDRNAAEILGVDIRNVRRWILGKTTPPRATVTLLRIMAEGLHHLPGAGDAWRGWTLRDGELAEPGANHGQHLHTPGSIRAWFWMSQQLQAARAEEYQHERAIQETGNVVGLSSARRKRWEQATVELGRRLGGGDKPEAANHE